MDLCIKTYFQFVPALFYLCVSILVLMDLCIKTAEWIEKDILSHISFNPCFNGSMYKNQNEMMGVQYEVPRFNPCFNGSMYKNFCKWCTR